MNRLGLNVCVALAALSACGDNSKECGTGTIDQGGVCTPDGTGPICGDGTSLDPATGSCLPDPSVCGGGTVLVNGTCQDPTSGLTVDLEEGPEPNGFDPGSSPAGNITLKAIDDPNGFVIHGCVKPTQDFADLDNYTLTVAGPTLIDITADGVQGLAAGFVTLGNDNDLANWERFGINLANDMSHREIYLPKAGTYNFVMSDTRSLLGLVDGATDYLEPAGNPDGTSCYYVTLKHEAIPAPTTMPVPAGVVSTFDNKVKFYSASMPTGFIDLTESVNSAHAAPAFTLVVNDQFHGVDTSGDLLFSGIKATDTSVVVADFAYNYAIQPIDFALTFTAASSAEALPTDGSTLSTTTNGTSFSYPDFTTVNQLYFDAAAADAIYGMDLTFSRTVQGAIVDQGGTFYGTFGGFGATNTFTTYKGLWRAPAAGRYYFVVFDPNDAAGTALDVTGTVTAITPGAATVGTALTAQDNNAFDSNLYTLDVTNNVWDSFDATGTNTGNLAVTVLDPASAYGRLDAVALDTGSTASVSPGSGTLIGGSGCPASRPGCTFNFPAAGGLHGFITKTLTTTNVMIKINPVAPTGAATFGFDAEPRVYTDLGAITAPNTTTNAGETVAAGAGHLYYVTTTPGNVVTITVHPTGTEDPVLDILAPNESAVDGADNGGASADEVFTFTQGATGFTAFRVTDYNGVAMTYDLTVDVSPPYYSSHTGTTAYADACSGGTVVPLIATGSYPADDEGLSAAIAAPAGFTFFGAATTQFKLGSNGFISFNTGLSSALAGGSPMPDGVGNVNISPLWEDLENVQICTKTAGTTTIIQWTGDEYFFTVPVEFQAILDTSDNSIEFVYGANNASDGTDLGGIGGVQNAAGDQGTMTGDGNVSGFAAANSSVKLTHP